MKNNRFDLKAYETEKWLKNNMKLKDYLPTFIGSLFMIIPAYFLFNKITYYYTKETYLVGSRLVFDKNIYSVLGAILILFSVINVFLSIYYSKRAREENVSFLYSFSILTRPLTFLASIFISLFNTFLYILFLIPGYLLTLNYGLSLYKISNKEDKIGKAFSMINNGISGYRLDFLFKYLNNIIIFIIILTISSVSGYYIRINFNMNLNMSMYISFSILMFIYSFFFARLKMIIARFIYLISDVKTYILEEEKKQKILLKQQRQLNDLEVSDNQVSFDIIQCPNCGMMVTSQYCTRCKTKVK